MICATSWELPTILSEDRYVLGMCFELIVAIASVLFWILMLRKWLQKRTNATRMLTIAYAGFLGFLFSTLVEKILVISNVIKYPDLVYGMKIGVIGGIGISIFVFAYASFMYEIFLNHRSWGKKTIQIFKIISVCTAVYGCIFLFIPVTKSQFELLMIPISVVPIAMLLPLYLISSITPFKLIKGSLAPDTAEKKLQNLSLRNIGINGWILLCFIILYGIDIVIPIWGMTILYFIAMPLMGCSYIFAYFGYFHPQWLKKYI